MMKGSEMPAHPRTLCELPKSVGDGIAGSSMDGG